MGGGQKGRNKKMKEKNRKGCSRIQRNARGGTWPLVYRTALPRGAEFAQERASAAHSAGITLEQRRAQPSLPMAAARRARKLAFLSLLPSALALGPPRDVSALRRGAGPPMPLRVAQAEQQDELLFGQRRLPWTEIRLETRDVERFHRDWDAWFGPDHPIHSYNARSMPRETELAVASAFQHAMRWLPQAVVREMLRLPHDPEAPAALLLRNIPIEEGVGRRMPKAEGWVLGAARALGRPVVPPGFSSGPRGGLVRDVVASPGMEVGLHRDFPAEIFRPFPEPDLAITLCVRSEGAEMLLLENAALVAALDERDEALLRSQDLRVEQVLSNGTVLAHGHPFRCIRGPAEAPLVTLYATDGLPGARLGGSEEALRAVGRAEALARAMAEGIVLQKGDMMIVANARVNHGRSAAGAGASGLETRWLRSYVKVGGEEWPARATYPSRVIEE